MSRTHLILILCSHSVLSFSVHILFKLEIRSDVLPPVHCLSRCLKEADRDEKRNQGAVDKQQSIWKLPSITQPNCPISRRYCPHTTSRFQPQGHTLATNCHNSTTCCQLRRNLPHLPNLLRILCHAIWQFYHASAHYTLYDLHLTAQHIPSRSHSDPDQP